MNSLFVLRILVVVCLACFLKIESSALCVQNFVVGGTRAGTNAAPYIVSLQYNNVHYCGGSILNTNWVVTAAHCLEQSNTVLNSILVAGSNNVKGTASTTQKRTISYFVKHELYNGGIAPYDIGLVYTSTNFAWTPAVQAVQLPTSGSTPTGNAILYGWGSISTTTVNNYPDELQVATLPIITNESCEKALGTQGNLVHNTNICTGPLTGGYGVCSSDSGGPLVQGSTLVGVVSWGRQPCGQVNSPSVYVKVSDFISWIQSEQNKRNQRQLGG